MRVTRHSGQWPFESWHQIALRRFNLQPSEFWNMPLRDWLGLLDGVKPQGFDRKSLEALIQTYPDAGETDELD